jgi:hypothetical protein
LAAAKSADFLEFTYLDLLALKLDANGHQVGPSEAPRLEVNAGDSIPILLYVVGNFVGRWGVFDHLGRALGMYHVPAVSVGAEVQVDPRVPVDVP